MSEFALLIYATVTACFIRIVTYISIQTHSMMQSDKIVRCHVDVEIVHVQWHSKNWLVSLELIYMFDTSSKLQNQFVRSLFGTLVCSQKQTECFGCPVVH